MRNHNQTGNHEECLALTFASSIPTHKEKKAFCILICNFDI